MKKILTLCCLFAAIMIFTSTVFKSSGPPGCVSGEPPNNWDCTKCHAGPPANSGDALVSFNLGGAEAGYMPGQTYSMVISLQKTGMQVAGFQTIALQNNDESVSPGDFILTEPLRTQRIDRDNPHVHQCSIGNRVWIEHRFNGIQCDSTGKCEWTYDWKAPNTPVGDISFYLALLEGDFDITSDGDHVYTRKVTISSLVNSTAMLSTEKSGFSVYPVPAADWLFFELPKKNKPLEVRLFDLTGKLVEVWQPELLTISGNTYGLVLNKEFQGSGLLSIRTEENHLSKMIFVTGNR